MANEYLTRTPTSAGNRKVFTWSGWVKSNIDNNSGNGNAIFICASANNGSQYHRTRIGRYVVGNDDFGLNHYDGANDNYGTQALKRDHSNWEHYICAVDTTKEQTTDRVKLYLNGVYQSDLTTVTAINKDLDTYMNGTSIHFVGADAWTATPNSYSQLMMSDIFLVDGQALTPDVFGFYKDGNGYISAGSTMSTDFRPGQWVPKKPSVIKNAINNSGGFGVNGFYLPMNDSSNFGADFHCTPNSIIKLKGEDLPQPRNGAPTTTDAYVSQLREDPYSANLVLAVPGISTATGANLITNGEFESDLSDWTSASAQFTHTYNDVGGNTHGKLMYYATGTNTTRNIYQNVTTETGKRYTLSFDACSDTASANTVQIDTTDVVTVTDNNNSEFVHHNISFTAASTSTQIKIVSTVSNRAYYDNFVVKQEDVPIDYSADIKGSGTNKTLTPTGNSGVGYELGNYYGSAMNFPYAIGQRISTTSSDFAFGTGDFTVEVWIYPNQVVNYKTIFATRPNNASHTDGFNMWIDANGATGVYSNAFLTQSANGAIVADQWTHVVAERYNGTLTTYVNGVAAAVQLSNTQNYTREVASIGELAVSDQEQFDGAMQDLRVYKGVAKYKGGFDVPKPYTPVDIQSWRQVSDCTANNFATFNPLHHGDDIAESDGNLSATWSGSGWQQVTGTIGVSTGKWYWESVQTSAGNQMTGIGLNEAPVTEHMSDNDDLGLGYYSDNGRIYYNSTNVLYGDTWTQNDIIGVAFNASDRQITFYKNGTSQGTVSGYAIGIRTEGIYHPAYAVNNSGSVSYNFGQNPTFSGYVSVSSTQRNADANGIGEFRYTPPSGFLALCEDNLPTPAIADPGDYFKTVLYRGDGNSGHSIAGVGFQPDLVWLKERTNTSSHQLHDSVRGAGNLLISNADNAEAYSSTYLYSLDSDGFTLGTSGGVNASADDYVAWCWKAGAGTTSLNTDGSINSVISVNQDAGFSIATWTGNGQNTQTIGHGLGKTPDFYIWKSRDNARNWHCAHTGLTAYNYTLYLDTNAGQVDNDKIYQAPDSTLIYPQNSNTIIGDDEDYVGYFWAEIEGFSKFGSYEGNSNADGPFVYCGFKPAWVMIKVATATNSWVIYDSSRNSINIVNNRLRADLSNVEDTHNGVDFLSNGFKLRDAGSSSTNASSQTFIFAAFAESPFQTANAK